MFKNWKKEELKLWQNVPENQWHDPMSSCNSEPWSLEYINQHYLGIKPGEKWPIIIGKSWHSITSTIRGYLKKFADIEK